MDSYIIHKLYRFKSWEQMKNTYRTDEEGDICVTPFYFCEEMQFLCGKLFRIVNIENLGQTDEEFEGEYYDEEDRMWHDVDQYSISLKMLVPFTKNKRIN